MIQPVLRKSHELTPDDLRQMHALMGFEHPAEETYLVDEHFSKMDTTTYLFKRGADILAYQIISWHELPTPFARRPLPLMYVNASYKREDEEVRDFGRRTNYQAIKRRFGKLWFFKRFVLVFTTINPRVVERAVAVSAEHYPNAHAKPSPAVQDFAQRIVAHVLKRSVAVNEALILPFENPGKPIDITDQWASLYAAKGEYWNRYFFEHGVFERRDERIYDAYQNLVLFFGVRFAFHYLLLRLKAKWSY